jgi:hypothetical protein
MSYQDNECKKRDEKDQQVMAKIASTRPAKARRGTDRLTRSQSCWPKKTPDRHHKPKNTQDPFCHWGGAVQEPWGSLPVSPRSLARTSMAALTAVSVPRLKSVPGTLLLMVAGMTHMMMQSSS